MRHLSSDEEYSSRPRRHSSSLTPQDQLAGPQHDVDDDTEALDRISDILSHLIKEASDAVNGIDHERTKISIVTPKSNNSSKHTMASHVKVTEATVKSSPETSTKPSKFQTHIQVPDHQTNLSHRRKAIKSMPPLGRHYESNAEKKDDKPTSSPMKRRSSGSIGKARWSRASANKEAMQTNLLAQRTGAASSSRALPTRSSHSLPNSPRLTRSPRRKTLLNEPLLESYKRIDDSLALVDSLSRDLAADVDAPEREDTLDTRTSNDFSGKNYALARNDPNQSLSLVIFLLVQGIHSVLAFLSGMLSLKSTGLHLETLESDTFYNALSWAFTYTMGNVLVDQCIKKAPVRPPRRFTIPGGYYSRTPSPPPLLLMPSSKMAAKNKQKAINYGTESTASRLIGLSNVVPSVSQSSSILEKESTAKSIPSRRNWANPETMIEKLVVQSPTRRFHYPNLNTADQNDDEEEVLQVLTVKRVRKTGSIRGNGVRILERRNST
jgi:hypothetical protein